MPTVDSSNITISTSTLKRVPYQQNNHSSGPHRQQSRPVGTHKKPTTPTTSESTVIRYSTEELLNLRRNDFKITRPVRKKLFANRIWKPRLDIPLQDRNQGIRHSNLVICTPTTSLDNNYPSEKFDQLKLGLLNARSINNKVEEITDTIVSNLDILAITETWLPESSDNNPAITQIINQTQNYQFISQPRIDRRGGGVCVIFKDTLIVSNNEVPSYSTFEVLDVNIF